jgi:hypothetical protein
VVFREGRMREGERERTPYDKQYFVNGISFNLQMNLVKSILFLLHY